MGSNVWTDLPGGEQSPEELEFRLQEAYRAMAGRIGWGRPMLFDQYDGSDAALRVRSLEPVVSLFADEGNYDNSVLYRGDNDGHAFTGPWGFTGDGTIDGNVDMTGDFNLTGDFTEVGNADIDGTLHVTGAVELDDTLHVVGAVTLDDTLDVAGAAEFATTVHIIGALTADANVTLGDAAADALLVKATSTFNEDVTFVKNVIVQGNTTLGNAAADTVTVTGTMTVAEDLTLTKGLIVDTTTLVVDEVLDKVGIGKVPTATDCKLTVVGVIESTDWVAPTSGESVIMAYIAASHLAVIRSANHGTGVYQSLFLDGSNVVTRATTAGSIDMQVNSASKFKMDNTGIRFYAGGAGVAKQTITGVRTGTLAQLQTVVANLLSGLVAYSLITDSTT